MSKFYSKARRGVKRIRFSILKWVGEYVEKPLTRFITARDMRRQGYANVNFVEAVGESEIYTWAMHTSDGPPTHVVKTTGRLGIRHRWRVRKSTPLVDYLTPTERIAQIIRRAKVLYEAGYGAKPASEPGDRNAVIEWANGTLLKNVPPQSKIIQTVISAVIELDQLGIHHGDLHAGNVVITADNKVLLFDSDNRYSSETSNRTALAADLAFLVGSLISTHGSENCVDGESTIAAVTLDSVGELLMADISKTATKHRLENRWFRAAAEHLRAPEN